jgi:predicted metal-binding protein
MCPPNTGTIEEIERKFKSFTAGVLIQYKRCMDVRNDPRGVRESKLTLHRIILETETYLREEMGFRNVMGMVGGDCALCDRCAGYRGEACPKPEKARPSLEALAVDVVALLRGLKLDTAFHSDRITWTGMVLFQ